ncbi:phosphatidylethanolamine N-methyltransferase [Pseudozyma hubeiensis SY62]|uniref:Phosphatidylethanolamine N-methyltransferase n=1 Tax=Pseudozyma hubeiensis (strain SY62) TaxID=1305764 RepID=R9PHJ2_PSEHS|nr:phosphatidylethanolamine N-methyltransferase [Pseudozyma hubeiensis SY62]GAC97585.1 phosphatidylethanolamine N-methyltransferase [Pseudozyma hubeiensis SY62]
MAATKSTSAVSSEGLRNRNTQSGRTQDSPRSDSTELASPTLGQDQKDSKDKTTPHQDVKVLGRTPDGTGKWPCSFPYVRLMHANDAGGSLVGPRPNSAPARHHSKRSPFGPCPLSYPSASFDSSAATLYRSIEFRSDNAFG